MSDYIRVAGWWKHYCPWALYPGRCLTNPSTQKLVFQQTYNLDTLQRSSFGRKMYSYIYIGSFYLPKIYPWRYPTKVSSSVCPRSLVNVPESPTKSTGKATLPSSLEKHCCRCLFGGSDGFGTSIISSSLILSAISAGCAYLSDSFGCRPATLQAGHF